MDLVKNWRRVLLCASSLWVTYGGVVLAVIYANLPLFSDMLGPEVFGYSMMTIGIAAAIARVVKQPESLPDK